jgi:hypothetical protein
MTEQVDLPPILEMLDLLSIVWDEKTRKVKWGNYSDLFCSVLFTHLFSEEVFVLILHLCADPLIIKTGHPKFFVGKFIIV